MALFFRRIQRRMAAMRQEKKAVCSLTSAQRPGERRLAPGGTAQNRGGRSKIVNLPICLSSYLSIYLAI
jgi:hypothetical protein